MANLHFVIEFGDADDSRIELEADLPVADAVILMERIHVAVRDRIAPDLNFNKPGPPLPGEE